MAMLELENVNVTYKREDSRVQAVEQVSLKVEKGHSLGIVGESGSGKSTLAMAVLRLLPKTALVEGSIRFKGQDLMKMSPEEIQKLRWKNLSVVFQKSMNTLSPVHKVGKQLMDMYRVHEPKASKKEIYDRMEELLGMVNLPPRVLNSYPHELSGGMMQRVSIAASLMHNPELLILDEATTALDVITQAQILREILKMKEKLDVTWLLITHDISVVSSCCDQIAVMYAGRLMEYGDVERVINHPRHPYTMGLLQSFPTLHGEKKNIKGIPGTMIDLSDKGEGCVFASRCPHATDTCKKVQPEMIGIEEQHMAACHLLKEVE